MGRRTGMPRIRKDGGQADLRRGKVGTSPQHRIKSYICLAISRISDDRALKVAGNTPGGLHGVLTEGMIEIGWHRRETRRKTEKTNLNLKPRDETEMRAIASDRHAEVSRGHIKPEETRCERSCGIIVTGDSPR